MTGLDKDKNDSIARDEFFALRRKLFAKLDTDRDGKLSFEEWSIKAAERFAGATRTSRARSPAPSSPPPAVKAPPSRAASAPGQGADAGGSASGSDDNEG